MTALSPSAHALPPAGTTDEPLIRALGDLLARVCRERAVAADHGDLARVSELDGIATRVLGRRLDAVAAAVAR